jgi:predicted phage terminase large subunit-like protein
MTQHDHRFIDAILREEFPLFLRRCLHTINPGTRFLPNWHIDAIAHELDRVRRGDVTRLIINMPPRNLKSITASVAFPAFLLGHDPRRKIFGISYGMDLAAKHASDFRSVVQSDWYGRVFPRARIRRISDPDVFMTAGGFRRATSTGAALTGLGGDMFIIDDPLKPVDALSEPLRNQVNQWFSNTLVSRLDNKATGAIIVVMQRVHLHDLTGHLLEHGSDWTVLSLPAIAEADEQIAIAPGQTHLRRAGEAIHPEHEPLEVLQKLRRDVGSEIFAAQYQQSPVPPGGAMIKRETLRYYETPPERTYKAKVIQSWDTAAKAGTQNDWSVGTTWLVLDNQYYLLDLTRGRYEYPKLRDAVLALAKRFEPNTILIEDASTGTALAQELRQMGGFVVKLIPVERDKTTRLYLQQAKLEAGQVFFPKNAPYLLELERELLSFPRGKNDDQVDSISQALAWKPKYLDYANV